MLTTNNGGALVGAPVTLEEVDMVKVKITCGTVVAGVKCRPGQVVETNETEARLIINMGKGVPADMQTRETQAADTLDPATTSKAKAKKSK